MPGVFPRAPRPQTPFFSAAADQVLRWIFPSNCLACERPRDGVFGFGVCEPCWRSLPKSDRQTSCSRCALPGGAPVCRHCHLHPPPVETTFAAGLFEGPLRRMIHAYKFRLFDHLSEPFSELIEASVRATPHRCFDAVVAVPSTRRRNRERGFDPAGLFGKEAARRMGIPFRQWLHRTRETVPQSTLPRARRVTNVKDAFEADSASRKAEILLIDDIMTTGATAFSAAKALKAAGAPAVSLAVLARTPELVEGAHLEAL